MEPLTNATAHGISSTGSAKTTSTDTSTTSETPAMTSIHANNDSITTTDSNTQNYVEQTSHSNISISWTAGTLTGTQKPEPTSKSSTNSTDTKQMAFSESTTTTIATTTNTGSSFPSSDVSSGTSYSTATTTQQLQSSDNTQVFITSNQSTTTTISSTTTRDSSSSIFTTTSEPNPLTTTSTTKSYPAIQATTPLKNTSLSDTSDSTSNHQSTATQTMEPLTNATAHGIISTGSAKTSSTDTSTTSETPAMTSIHANNDSITTTDSNTQNYVEQTSHSNISISWTAGTLTGTQNPEPTTETSTNICVTKKTAFSELTTTTIATTINTDSSSSIFTTTSKPNHITNTNSTTLFETSSPDIPVEVTATPELINPERSQRTVTAFRASTLHGTSTTTATLVPNHLQTQGTVSRQAVTSDSKSTSMNTPSMFPTTQENQKTNTQTSLNPISPPPSPITATSNDSKPVTTPLAHEHRDSTLGILTQTGLNRSDSEGTTISDTWSNNISSTPAGLTKPPLSSKTSIDGNADNSANSVKSTTVFVFNTPKVPVFKTITFNYPLVNQVTVMKTVSRP
ncbi:serine-rich adhesin for platelets-like [Sinocyclocheilus anshuiensis]|uniref:serine-rich adhesin for platelets-like n=1 Tax=Sinocyclocheilus anshuiensis TaxID=1608454 RepID=UPI0007B8C1BA|nr:PREDICTED: serine-rich adhesin for platelets-like [Sinocyclocheilus anshuiensis]